MKITDRLHWRSVILDNEGAKWGGDLLPRSTRIFENKTSEKTFVGKHQRKQHLC